MRIKLKHFCLKEIEINYKYIDKDIKKNMGKRKKSIGE
jgi:hypothetical protein